MFLQESTCARYPVRYQFKLLIRRIATVSISQDEVALNFAKYVSEVFRIGTVWPLYDPQSFQRGFTSRLHEVNELMYFEERQERV